MTDERFRPPRLPTDDHPREPSWPVRAYTVAAAVTVVVVATLYFFG